MTDQNKETVKSVLIQNPWEKGALEGFEKVLDSVPGALRGIAETRVSKKAESLVIEEGRDCITEKDMVAAFFAETPGGFLGPMTLRMEELNIDYKKYGFKYR